MRARDWIKSYDALAEDYNWPEQMRINKLFSYLSDHALSWYFDTIQDKIASWKETKAIFIQRFGVSDVVSYEEIHTLRWDFKKESLAEYFQRALNMLNNAEIKSKLQIEILSRGLPLKMREKLVVTEIKEPSEWYEVVRKINSFREVNFDVKKFDRSKGVDGSSEKFGKAREENNFKSDSKCIYCEKTNHQSKARFFNPKNRTRRVGVTSDRVNAVEVEDSASQISIEDESIISNVLAINTQEKDDRSDQKYCIMKINDIISVEGLVD